MRVLMKIVLETPDGEKTDEITADARDIRHYESEFDVSFLTSELSLIQLTQLAYVTMKRLKKFVGSWDVFDGQCVDIESVDAPEPAPKATLKAAGGGR